MNIDWTAKLRHLLQVMAFALVIATIQYAFMPERPWGPPLVYSLLIAGITWAGIDIGRHLFPSSAETGWPPGWAGLVLVAGSIVLGYVGGTWIADTLCKYYGWYPPGAGQQDPTQLRNSILITALAGIAGSFYFYSISKSAYLIRKMDEARQHASEARLKLLETQLEPHMLFNTLANLRALIATDPPRAQVMLDHMIDYLRATLGASLAPTHTLQAEFDRLRDYLEHGNVVNAVNFPAVVMARESVYRVAIANANVPNMLGQMSTAMAQAGLNIHNMVNKSRGDMAYTLVDVDSPVSDAVLDHLRAIGGVLAVRYLPDLDRQLPAGGLAGG